MIPMCNMRSGRETQVVLRIGSVENGQASLNFTIP